MSTQTTAPTALSAVVAANIRAEAARRGWTQAEMCRRLSMTPVTMSDRYRERTPWTLDELDRVAGVMDMQVSDLVARPKGFEPLTFWLGADHTLTGFHTGSVGRFWWRLFCDGCGTLPGSLDEAERLPGRARRHGERQHPGHYVERAA